MKCVRLAGSLLDLVVLRGRSVERGDVDEFVIKPETLRLSVLVGILRERDRPEVFGRAILKGGSGCLRTAMDFEGQGPNSWANGGGLAS